MRILFVHNNYPAQFGRLGHWLAARGDEVTFLTKRKGARSDRIRVVVYKDRAIEDAGSGTHPWLIGTNDAVITGASAMEVGLVLKKEGYAPDVIVAHTGWGPGLFLKDVWPEARFIAYGEWYYNGDPPDARATRERPATVPEAAKQRIRNAVILPELLAADAIIVPTAFQAAQFPPEFRERIRVMHDGIDTEYLKPAAIEPFSLGGVDFAPGDRVVTYVARGMEPYRGFPTFMRALKAAMDEDEGLKAIVLGEDRVAYGAKLPEGDSWKARMLKELDPDLARIAMPGLAPRDVYRRALRISSVHCYLTVPFVLSWSMLEAMAAGCTLVASDTAPVREVIEDGVNGRLVPMEDPLAVKDALIEALSGREGAAALGRAARQTILQRYEQEAHFAAKRVLMTSLMSEAVAGAREDDAQA